MPRWSARSRWLMPRSRRPCWSIRPSASGVGISPRTRAMAPPGVGAGGDDFDSDVMIGEVDIDVKGGDFENGVDSTASGAGATRSELASGGSGGEARGHGRPLRTLRAQHAQAR